MEQERLLSRKEIPPICALFLDVKQTLFLL